MIPFGPGPLPTDSADLVTRLTAQLIGRLRMRPEHVVVDGELSTDVVVERLLLDLSGQDIQLESLSPRTRGEAPERFTDESPTCVRTVSVTGDPLQVLGAPVWVRLDATEVPAVWQRDGDGHVWLTPRDQVSPHGPMSARAAIQGDVAAATAAVAAVAARVARQRGLTVRDLRITVTPVGRNHMRMDVQGTVAKAILRSKVTAQVEVRVDEALVAHVETLDASVGGFLRGIAQPVIERQLAQWRGRSVQLADRTFAGARLNSLDINVDPAGAFRISAST